MGGTSIGDFAGLNVGAHVGDDLLLVKANRSLIPHSECLQCRKRGRLGFHLWVGKILWVRKDPLVSTYSSVLAWGIPWTEEPGELQTMET